MLHSKFVGFRQWLELVWPDVDEPKATQPAKRPDIAGGAGFQTGRAKLSKWRKNLPPSDEKNSGYHL